MSDAGSVQEIDFDTNTKTQAVAEAVRLLFYWQYSGDRLSPSFHDCLYMLFQKADMINLAKLRTGFPAEHIAWKLWHDSNDQDKFFIEWGFDPSRRA